MAHSRPCRRARPLDEPRGAAAHLLRPRGDPPLRSAGSRYRYDLILPSGRRGKGRRRFDDDVPAPRGRRPARAPSSWRATTPPAPPNGPRTSERRYVLDLAAGRARPHRDRSGWSPISAPSTPSSASSRPARRPTSTCVERGAPRAAARVCWPRSGTGRSEHRMFHRDAGYLEGRRCGARARPGRWRPARRSAAT